MARPTQAQRTRHVPQRTCIACRQGAGKRALVRIVRTTTGVEIDPSGKKAGRGAYLHPNLPCWQAALSGNRLGQALRTTISPADRAMLTAFAATLPTAGPTTDDDTPGASVEPGSESGAASAHGPINANG